MIFCVNILSLFVGDVNSKRMILSINQICIILIQIYLMNGDIKIHAEIEFLFYQYVGADAATEETVPFVPQ
jgi:hypothetical protein